MSASKKKIRSSGFWGGGRGGPRPALRGRFTALPIENPPRVLRICAKEPGTPRRGPFHSSKETSVSTLPHEALGSPWVLSTVGELGALSEGGGPPAALPSLRPSHQQRKGDPGSEPSYMKGRRKQAFCDLQPMEGGLLDHVFYDLADLENFCCEEVSLLFYIFVLICCLLKRF